MFNSRFADEAEFADGVRPLIGRFDIEGLEEQRKVEEHLSLGRLFCSGSDAPGSEKIGADLSIHSHFINLLKLSGQVISGTVLSAIGAEALWDPDTYKSATMTILTERGA